MTTLQEAANRYGRSLCQPSGSGDSHTVCRPTGTDTRWTQHKDYDRTGRGNPRRLIVQGYIKKGKLTQKYFDEKKADSLQFGEVENLHSFIIKQLDKVFNPDAFKPANGRNKTEAHLVKDNFNKKEWQRVVAAHQYTYLL